MKYEIASYLFISALLFSLSRIMGGMKNGCFYAKGNNPVNPKIKPYVDNLHRIEAPLWYIFFGSLFFLSLAIFRSLDYSPSLINFSLKVVASLLVTMGSSAVSSYWYQGWINIGAGDEWVNENENPKAEFAIRLFGKNYSFWWNRPWKGKYRIMSSVFGLLQIILGIVLGIFI